MKYPCDNCIKADVCKYKENVKQELNTICNSSNDIITATYSCKYAKYNDISAYYGKVNSSTTVCRDDNSTSTLNRSKRF